jgi:hypothetical protein
MNAALEALGTQRESVTEEDVARLSPFGHRHMNYFGHYSFDLPEIIHGGKLRPSLAQGHFLELEEEQTDEWIRRHRRWKRRQ